MKKMAKMLGLLLLCSLGTGCISLSHEETEFLSELEACGISKTEKTIRYPATAGALSVIPGAGNFYLAANTWADGQWLAGAANIITWPLSPVWAVPQTITDANTINMRETVHYYRHNPHGRAYLARLQHRLSEDPNSTCGKVMAIEHPHTTMQ